MVKLWKKTSESDDAIQPVHISPAELVQQKLDAQTEVRPFPAAVTRLINALRDENATPANYAEIIQCDAGLAVRLLKMANSPLHGLTTEVRTVAHATSVLGARSLQTFAMSAAGASMFAQGSSAARLREELWRHSLGVGAVARVLAESEPEVKAEDAFLGGVFHDVGKLFFLDVVPDEYEQLNNTYLGEELIEQERSMFGVTHEAIGLRSAHAWNLAENLKIAIGYHHRVSEAPAHVQLAAIVHLANDLARAWGIGTVAEQPEHVCEQVRQRLESDADSLTVVRQRAEAEFVETQEICA